ncbi:cytochrome C [Brevundimonas sp. Leaf363]|uniref:c-type cytochrome n=1 Tax=Brevundimonas sp. Leaf363 TaxID=1736353 RepID=UPI0006FC1350|nr:cytochrome c family protein [Brevundimonas sp. Leaf363]KQS56142.1 cytochrome C [Brevundimonas sp. Leaf363]
MRALPALLLCLVPLASCGPQTPATPAKPPRVLSDTERAALLANLPAPYNTGDLENGRRVFARCRSCHTITEGGSNMTGPNLWGLFGRQAGSHAGFNYSQAVKGAGFAWDADHLNHWLANPRTFLPANKMAFPGLEDATDRRDVIAFLKVETGYQP